ncbi:MAG TPA: hypothetical protein VKC66_15115 [Xanthobacteraceae bacterium]|nr:hypothetical protein [Xanthobacteraceae bacterium]
MGTHRPLFGGGKIYMTSLYLALLVGSALWSDALLGQPADQASDAVRVGDRWVYDTKDEITGFPKATYSHVVTEVSPKEIVVSLTFRGQNNSSLMVYDHNWNRIEQPNAKFRPNDGQGIRLPLAVGKEWRAEYEARATQTGATSKGSVVNKVVGQETVTTPAGTFDTFKIESRIQNINTADPSQSYQYENVMWFAPQLNHWVRRKLVTKIRNRTTQSTSEELTDFSRNF